jgi:hypothetical protein
MQIAPLPVNHTGMHGEDMATAVAWYRPSLGCYLIDGRVRFTDADPTSGRSRPARQAVVNQCWGLWL